MPTTGHGTSSLPRWVRELNDRRHVQQETDPGWTCPATTPFDTCAKFAVEFTVGGKFAHEHVVWNHDRKVWDQVDVYTISNWAWVGSSSLRPKRWSKLIQENSVLGLFPLRPLVGNATLANSCEPQGTCAH